MIEVRERGVQCYFNNRLAGICLKIAAPLRWAVMRITTGSFPAAHFCKFERMVGERGRETGATEEGRMEDVAQDGPLPR